MLTLSDHLIELIQAPYTAIWASNADQQHTPDLVRLAGVKVEAEKGQLLMFVSLKFGGTFLKNVKTSQSVSFLCTSVRTLEAYQLKGLYLSQRPCSPEEISPQKEYLLGFSKAIENLGAPSVEQIFDCFFQQPSLAVYMLVEEIFEQTPKPGTGQKLVDFKDKL